MPIRPSGAIHCQCNQPAHVDALLIRPYLPFPQYMWFELHPVHHSFKSLMNVQESAREYTAQTGSGNHEYHYSIAVAAVASTCAMACLMRLLLKL